VLLLPKETDVSFKSKWRAVIDFRKLNEWAVGYTYPVPNINYISDHLGKAEYFPSVDQVVSRKVSAKSEFGMPTGRFEFLPFSMGLKRSPDILIPR
jgi:hypothetical protein